MDTILQDESKFIKLVPVDKSDLSSKVEKAFQQKLRSWFVKRYISQDLYEFIKPNGSQCPKLYGLPKTHKKSIPRRPILDIINYAQYRIAKLLISVLSPVSNKFYNFCVKDSFNFVEILRKNSCLSDQMCSFDIKSFLTNVPLDKTISICIKGLMIQTSVHHRFSKRFVAVCCTWQLKMLNLDSTTLFIDKLMV